MQMEKNFMILAIVVIIIVVIAAFSFSGWYPSESDNKTNITNNSSIQNNTSHNNTNRTNTSIKSTAQKSKSTPIQSELIDSGTSLGYDDYYWDSNYVNSWKAYAVGTSKVLIYAQWNFIDAKKVIKQTIIIRESPDNKGLALVDISPKMSGVSNWETLTSMKGNKNAIKFYWNGFRKTGLVDGYWS